MLSIIIVNYNTHDHVEKCLNSIYQNTNLPMEVIVVDNNSPQRDIEIVEKKFSQARFIYLDSNLGFGAGCNAGVRVAKGEYILFLNPDIVVQPGSIEQLYKIISEDPSIGIVSGALVSEGGEFQYSYNNFPDLKWEFKEAFGLSLMNTINSLNKYAEQKSKSNESFEADWFHGACMMMSMKVFEDAGRFDEKIFLYYEDVDLCYKVKKTGLKNVCVPYAKFIHHERGSIRDKRGEIVYHYFMHKSKLYYNGKHRSFVDCFIIRLFFISGSLIKTILLPFRKKFRNEMASRFTGYKTAMLVHLNYYNKLPV